MTDIEGGLIFNTTRGGIKEAKFLTKYFSPEALHQLIVKQFNNPAISGIIFEEVVNPPETTLPMFEEPTLLPAWPTTTSRNINEKMMRFINRLPSAQRDPIIDNLASTAHKANRIIIYARTKRVV